MLVPSPIERFDGERSRPALSTREVSADAHPPIAKRVNQRAVVAERSAFSEDLDQAALGHLLELAGDRVINIQRAVAQYFDPHPQWR